MKQQQNAPEAAGRYAPGNAGTIGGLAASGTVSSTGRRSRSSRVTTRRFHRLSTGRLEPADPGPSRRRETALEVSSSHYCGIRNPWDILPSI